MAARSVMLISETSVPRRGMMVTKPSRCSRWIASRTGVRPTPSVRISSSSRSTVPGGTSTAMMSSRRRR
jgi:hypothetical protein